MTKRETQDLYYDSARPILQVIYFDGKLSSIENIVKSVTISGDVAKSGRTCTISFKNTSDARKRIINIENGKELRILAGEQEVFRGIIFSFGRNETADETITAHTANVYLVKNTPAIVKYENQTADFIIKDLCSKYGIKVGQIDSTGFSIPKLIIRGKSLFDIFVIALTETQKATGARFMLNNKKGQLVLIKIQAATRWLRIEPGKNLISASYTESIEDVKTKVTLTTGDDDLNPTMETATGNTSAYGIMEFSEHKTDVAPEALKTLAEALLVELQKPKKEMNVETLGVPGMQSGEALIVEEALSGLKGGYFVMVDNHNFDSKGIHTMSLVLSKTLDLPFMEYEPPEDKKAKESINDSGNDYKTNYTTGWLATAYDPKLGGINTSGDPSTTATSTKWAYNRTIAVDPKVIPYGSVVAIKAPTMPQYSGLYVAEDTGGAIKGKRIDILIKGKKATSDFGRRDVEVAILKQGKGAGDARATVKDWKNVKEEMNKLLIAKPQTVTAEGASGQAQKIVATANSYKGGLKYVFGGKNLASGGGDCSGFTYTVYKKHGVDIGHGTSIQVGKGTKIATNQAQPGDLIFFQGTYRAGVSHVGIVTRTGYWVGLQSKGCTEESYTSGYWGKHFMQIRRVL